MRYQPVSRLYNSPGRTIIGLQLHHLELWVGRGEFDDILDFSPSKGVNTLGIVTHYAEVVVLLGKLVEYPILHNVSVLVLIYQDVGELFLITLSNIWMVGQKEGHLE